MSSITPEELKASYDEKFKTLFHKMERIEKLTDNIHQLTISINEIAHGIKTLSEQTKKNTQDIDELQQADAIKYRNIIGYITTLVIGAIIGYIIKQIGIG